MNQEDLQVKVHLESKYFYNDDFYNDDDYGGDDKFILMNNLYVIHVLFLVVELYLSITLHI